MNRKPFIVAVLAVGGLVTAAEVRSTLDEQRQRLEAFRAQAQVARKAQKLDKDRKALVAKYPTPEIGMLQPVDARAGSEVTLVARGLFVPDSLVTVLCEGVEVLSTKVTKERAEARVRVLPNAAPADCDLHVVSPVSAIGRSERALSIKGDYVWELKLANGMTTRWTVATGKDDSTLLGKSEWFHNGKPLGTRDIVVSMTGQDARATVAASAEETEATIQAGNANSANIEAISKKMGAVMQKMDAECSKLPPEKMVACSDKYRPQMEALNQEFTAGAQQSEAAMNAVKTVCTSLDLKALNGKVTGTANQCAGGPEVQVSGTYKPGPGK